MSFEFLGLSTFQILAVMGETQPDREGLIDIPKFAASAAGMIYTMVDLAGQNLRVAAVEHLAQTEGANFLRGLPMEEVKSILYNAFTDADVDKNGTLSINEIATILNELKDGKLQLQDRDVIAIISAIGKTILFLFAFSHSCSHAVICCVGSRCAADLFHCLQMRMRTGLSTTASW